MDQHQADIDTSDILLDRIADRYDRDFADYLAAITAPYSPRSDTADCRKRQRED